MGKVFKWYRNLHYGIFEDKNQQILWKADNASILQLIQYLVNFEQFRS